MKIMFASDLHGSEYYCRKMLEIYEKEGADRLWILGDFLYHGPRNNLPKEYEPKEVLHMLNDHKQEICGVRGNCDTEVDQMVLEFPIMADYALLCVEDLRIYATHGHKFNEDHMPPLQPGDVLIHGHTHLPLAKKEGDHYILNPGSVSIPKGGYPSSYAILENRIFTIRNLDGEEMMQIELQ